MGQKIGAYESVTVDIENQVAQVTLVGPGKGNAMGPAFWAEMPEVFAKLDADRDVRAIVLAGSGKNFSYGLDLPAMGGSLSGVLGGGRSARPRADFHATILRMQGAITAVADCRTPTIASVHGREDRSGQRRLRRRRRVAGGCARDGRRDRRQPAAGGQRSQGCAGSAAHRPRLREPALRRGVERGVLAVKGSHRGAKATFEKRKPDSGANRSDLLSANYPPL